jgi:O-antigen ligase
MNTRFALHRRPAVGSGALTMAIVIPLALGAAWGAIALEGTKTGVALAMLAVLGPIAAYAGLTSPLIFPFCLFVVLVPFDNLLLVSSFSTLTKLLAILSGAAILLWLVRGKRYITPDKAVLPWMGFTLLAVTSLIWAIDPTKSLDAVGSIVELFGLYVALSFMPVDMRTLGVVTAAVLLGGAIASLYGIYLFNFHSGGVDVLDSRLRAQMFAQSGDQNYIDPNHFAAALLLPFSIALMAVVESRSMAVRLVCLCFLVVFAAGIAIAGSRGALVAIVAMLLYLLWRSRNRLVVAGVALAGLGVALASYGHILQRFNEPGTSTGSGRLEIWKVGLTAFRNSPIVGQGFGSFPFAYDRAYMTVSLDRNVFWHRAPHNNLLWVAVELGIVGLAIFLYAWWAQFRAVRWIAVDHPLYSLRLALEGGMIALFVASLFLGTVTYKYLWLVFIMIMLARNAWVVDTVLAKRRSTQ